MPCGSGQRLLFTPGLPGPALMLMNLNLHPQRRCASSSIRRLASLVLLAALAAAALSAGAASSSKRLDQANKIIQEAAADAAVQEHQKIYQRAAGLLNANKAAEAEQLLRPAIARLEDPPSTMTSPLLGGDLFLLARALRMQNRAQEALAPSERSVALLRAGSATILVSPNGVAATPAVVAKIRPAGTSRPSSDSKRSGRFVAERSVRRRLAR